jgi:hypothetical protein
MFTVYLSKKRGTIKKILLSRKGIQKGEIEVAGKTAKVINYTELTGFLKEGDEVIVNTTAIELGLGSGGYHFVVLNFSNLESSLEGTGHIIKMRYTPYQLKVLSIEEQTSSYHEKMKGSESLRKMPVIICSLHSMIPCAAGAVKELTNYNAKIAYVMTDGGALPCVFSDLVHLLKKNGFIDVTITAGHAFGGDFEAINIYSGLLAAKNVLNCDIAIVGMGPGITGSGTKYGFSGIEQGEIINSVAILGGIPIAVPRISFGDPRKRHYGVSHHTLTILREIALKKAIVALHKYEQGRLDYVLNELQKKEIDKKHRIIVKDGSIGVDAVVSRNIKLSTMNRGIDEEYDFFCTSGAAGAIAVDFL